MRRVLVMAAVLCAAGALGSAAADCGDGGSPPNAVGSCDTAGDQVRCGPGTATPAGGVLSANPDGVEFCNEGTDLAIQGRAGAGADCMCIYADGDDDNDHDLLLNGWVRVDAEGVHCRERGKPNTQSYNSSEGSDLQGCVM